MTSRKTPAAMIRDKFNGQRRIRPWGIEHFGGMDAVKAHPLAICNFHPGEGGTVGTKLDLQLAPVDGHMRSQAYVDVKQIFVPYQAIEKLYLDEQEDAGVTEMTRRRLEAKEYIPLEPENEITKAAFIHPRSIGGVKKVDKTARLAYLCAVNHLRLTAYFRATTLPRTATVIQPAVLTANVLQRFNGVLDPEKLVDGAVQLTGELPVRGIGIDTTPMASAQANSRETGGENVTDDTFWIGENQNDTTLILREDPDNPGYPKITAQMAGTAGTLTLRDMMKAKKLDGLIRGFAAYVKADPIHGEERVARAIYGLQVDYGADCHVLYDEVHALKPVHHRPSDGPSVNDVTGHFAMSDQWAVMVPTSELGGKLVTIVSVKPMEVLSQQPDPHQTAPFGLVNRVHEELELDEQLLTRADIETDLQPEDEDQPVFWVGHNQLMHGYMAVGPNEQQTYQIPMKSSMWVYPVPTSVTPSNINYPSEGIDMYPFAHWDGKAAEYNIRQIANISTTLPKGPNPVERLQLFVNDPSLIDDEA